VIATDIEDKISADPDTKDSQITVAAKDGKVALSGEAKSHEAQKKVEQIAREEPGTTVVDNQTTVPQPVVLPAGTVLTVITSQRLSSNTSQTGQTFLASLTQPVNTERGIALPSRSTVTGTVVTAKEKGKIKGEGELALALTSVSAAGRTYQIETKVMTTTIKGKGKRTATTTGGGAVGGALIGGLAGGGKGMGIGALVGGGAGFVGGALTGNKQIEVPAESVLSFTLAAPLTLPPPGE
jgi:hypothetical protein